MIKNLFALENLLYWLLIFIPIAIVLELQHAAGVWIFASSALAIIPLAGLMGKATEHLAAKMGEGVGGLLNATFGNAAELIIALMALRKGLYKVVKASITGSIIGNILLVLGLSIVAATAAAHGGSVSVTSEPGHGATARVNLDFLTRRHPLQ